MSTENNKKILQKAIKERRKIAMIDHKQNTSYIVEPHALYNAFIDGDYCLVFDRYAEGSDEVYTIRLEYENEEISYKLLNEQFLPHNDYTKTRVGCEEMIGTVL